jgi:hypothetical protein
MLWLWSICIKSNLNSRILYRPTELVKSIVFIEWQAGTDPSVARPHNHDPVRHLQLSVAILPSPQCFQGTKEV